MRPAQDAARTKSLRLETRHAGLDAEFLGRAIGRDDDAVAAPPAADPDRATLQFGIQGDLATGEETVAIHVQDAVGRFCVHGQTLIEPKFMLCQILARDVGQWRSKASVLIVIKTKLPCAEALFPPLFSFNHFFRRHCGRTYFQHRKLKFKRVKANELFVSRIASPAVFKPAIENPPFSIRRPDIQATIFFVFNQIWTAKRCRASLATALQNLAASSRTLPETINGAENFPRRA